MRNKIYIALTFYFIIISFSWGQRPNELDLSAMCFCYKEKDQNLLLKHFLSFKDKHVEVLILSKCAIEEERFPGWTEQAIDTVCDIIKSIKGISLLKVGKDKDLGLGIVPRTPTDLQNVQFLRILGYLPPAQNAEVYFGGQFTKNDTTTLWNSLRQTPLIFDVRQKVIIKNYFNIEEELEWDGKTGISFPNLDTLVIENLATSYLHPSFGYGMDNLTVLVIQNEGSFIGLKGLPNSIGHLKKLKVLHLAGNNDLGFHIPESFGDLENLEELYVRSIHDQFPHNIIKLQKLKKLVLRGYFTTINPNFFKLAQLDSIAIYSEDINSLPYMGGLVNLKHLYLEITSSKFKMLPIGMEKLQNLKTLQIFTYHPIDISKSIASLENLEALIIHKTKKLPDNLGQLKSLKVLKLYGFFTKIPESIGELKNLRVLELGGLFAKIPASIGELQALESIGIGAYALREFPDIVKLTNLKSLDLHIPKAKKLPKDFFSHYTLKHISLNAPFVKKMPDFKIDLDSLTTFYLSSLSNSLPQNFDKLKNLKSLSIESFATNLPDAIATIDSLSILNLNMPKLETLPNKMKNLTHLHTFYLLSDAIEQLPVDWKFPKLQNASFFTPKIDLLPKFLLNCEELKNLNIGYTIKDIEKCCVFYKLKSCTLRGDYTRHTRCQPNIFIFSWNKMFKGTKKGYPSKKGYYNYAGGDIRVPYIYNKPRFHQLN